MERSQGGEHHRQLNRSARARVDGDMPDRRLPLRLALTAAASVLALAACNGGSKNAQAGDSGGPLDSTAAASPSAAAPSSAAPSVVASTHAPVHGTTTPTHAATSSAPAPRSSATSHPTVAKTSPKPTSTAASPCPNNTSSTALAMVNSGTEYAFSPASLSVTCGGTVKITNNSTYAHTMSPSHGGFSDSGDVEPAMTASVRFSYRGTFSFFCSIHTYMTGSVKVA
jgi:plastocyanin